MNTLGEVSTYIDDDSLLKESPELLAILLQDMTTGKNIIWATDNYVSHGSEYEPDKEIKIELITGEKENVIRPRVKKSKAEQQRRIKQKAEVFTPSWVCNLQINLGDKIWFDRENVFNIEKEVEKTWEPIYDKITFPNEPEKTWQDYIGLNRMEITCGEAPYLTSRYDTVSGEPIAVKDRIGMLDRKLRIASENVETEEEWLKWATVGVQSIYGFEWQGDNILIARKNLLYTVAEYYADKFKKTLAAQELVGFAKIIVWNIWQMDGLRFVVPNSCTTKEVIEQDLFESRVISKPCEGCKLGYGPKSYFKHNGIYCNIRDWKEDEVLRFADLLKGDKND